MREIGRDSVVVIGGEDGRPRAFHNVCRHRGARLITEAEGSVKRRLRCPYHAWSYDLDGALRASPHMDGVEGFDPSCNGLVAGAPLDDRRPAPGRPGRRGAGSRPSTSATCSRTSSATGTPSSAARGKVDYVVAANWKGIVENYNECLHCPGVHPELNALSNYMSGEEMEGDGAWCGGSMTLTGDGAATMGERRRPRDRPAADRGPLGGASCARSSTSRSSRTPWSRSIPTT